MLILENFKIAIKSIFSNKIRAFLTMLGVIIGVSSVVSLMAMGQGVKSDIAKEVVAIGSNLLIVFPGNMSDSSGGNFSGMAGISNLTWQDREAIGQEIKGISHLAAIMLLQGTFEYQDKKTSPFLVAGEADLEFTNLYNLKSGRFFSEEDINKENKIAAIGTTVVKDLFGSEDPINKKIKVNQKEFKVVGVMETESMGSLGMDANSMAIIPISVGRTMFKSDQVMRILMQVENKDNISKIQQEVKDLLLKRHNNNEDFSVLTQEDVLKMLDKILGLVTALLSGIAAISLVVGGIGIMNIMLVSVTERTREIGIRKALGATNINILIQFLIEATLISFLGGLIGVILSYIASFLTSQYSPLTPHITNFALILSFSISCGVGIVFGVAPAVKAARKNPIEALRYE